MGLFNRKKKAVDPIVYAMVSGRILPLSEVPDEVFSQKILGDGFAIAPTDEVVLAPAEGTVTVLMEGSGHACGLSLACGIDLLVHLGVDTVNMQGEGFEELVSVGDTVTTGTPLIRFSSEAIAKAGHSDVVICVVAEPNGKAVRIEEDGTAIAGETPVMVVES